MNNNHLIFAIRDYLVANDSDFNEKFEQATRKFNQRQRGKVFTINEHIQAMILAMLSANRPWKGIEKNREKIDCIFGGSPEKGGYDPGVLENTSPEYYISEIKRIKCGNKSLSSQMKALKDNVRMLCSIESNTSKSLNDFFSGEKPLDIANKLSESGSTFKLKGFGLPLACEFLKNVGIDCVKPDVHLCRFFGCSLIGDGSDAPATAEEVFNQVESIHSETKLPFVAIDFIIWRFGESHFRDSFSQSAACIQISQDRKKRMEAALRQFLNIGRSLDPAFS